jgi:hypothetical protein
MNNAKSFLSTFLLILLLGLQALMYTQCDDSDTTSDLTNLNSGGEEIFLKQKGAHIFGYLDSANVQPFIKNNINWITMVPYAAQKDVNTPAVVFYRGDSTENARKDSTWKSQICVAHENGFKVFLKPHIWLTDPTDNQWRSDIFPANEEDWQLWKKDYRAYILMYAKIAADNEVEMYCIGAELSRLVVEKTNFWIQLIKDVKQIYSGKLTYAANWNAEYKNISFWNELDYIGIQAYFPLSNKNNPSVVQISQGWKKYLSEMESISKTFDRKVLFTEMGYKSTNNSAIEPWTWAENISDKSISVSLETQANCYQAFFNTVWNKEWFAGVHIWQMRSDYMVERPEDNMNFSPQGKSAEQVINRGFQ